jgi:glycosyltransferase involved in cell wall biosynthesis
MKFSIIIPAYNVENYLPDCLLSIQKQSFRDFEVLIVDDGSTDGTRQVAKKFASHDSRFKVFQKENGGVSSARNVGLEHAIGKFVWFIDGDDYIHPESLAYLEGLFDEHPDADYATFDYDWTKKRYDGRFPSLESLCQREPQYFDCTVKEGFENALRFSPIAVCCVCYRRRLTDGHTFQDIRTAEDRLYALQMCFEARGVIQAPAKIYNYFQRAGSSSRNITRAFMVDRFEFADMLLKLHVQKQGWGVKHLHFSYCVEFFPGIMQSLLKLRLKDDRKWAFEQLLERMAKVQSVFPDEPNYHYIDRIVAKKSFILARLFLVIRYLPRQIITKYPLALTVYQKIKQLSGRK